MTTTQSINMDDPFVAAENATLRPREYWGQLAVDAYFAKLVKGMGKVPFDPLADPIEQRVTAISLGLTPLPESGLTFNLTREMIAESVEWVRIVWPSLREHGVQNAKAADGLWVKLIQQPTGRKYRTRSGEEREATTFKILEVYPNEDACRAAYLAAHPGNTEADTGFGDDLAEAISGKPQPQTAQPEPDARARETAKAFIAALAKQHRGDMEKIRATVASIPMITKCFDPDGQEFAQIVAENMA